MVNILSPMHLAAVGVLLLSASEARTQNVVFPTSSSVINIKSLGATGDGKTDVSTILENAVRQNTTKIVYLPNGTYLISRGLSLAVPGGASAVGCWIYGQSRDSTIIVLKDGATGFGDSTRPTSVLRSVDLDSGVQTSADHFMITWHNFTLRTGNNPGAIGIRYYSNNVGCLDNVRIVGNGRIGVDMAWLGLNGPCIVSNAIIDGFAYGITTSDYHNSQTLYNVTINNARTMGIYLLDQPLFVENLTVSNTPEGIHCSNASILTLINGNFSGKTGATNAVMNYAACFLRNITSSGFVNTLWSGSTRLTSPAIAEYVSGGALSKFPGSGTTSLNLPIKPVPDFAWETNINNWVVAASGTSAAVQAAVNTAAAANKTTVAIPYYDGNFGGGIVSVHGSVRHIIGLGYARMYGPGGFVLAADAAPVVKFENQYSFGGTPRTYQNNNTSTMIFESCEGVSLKATGSGDIFWTNSGGDMVISNPKAHVWARQINMEQSTLSADVQGGTLWILGLKTEKDGPKIRVTGGGHVEVLGTFLYQTNTINPDTSKPAFELVDSYGCFAGLSEADAGLPFNTFVKETRGSTTQYFRRLDNPGGFRLGLYAGYDQGEIVSVNQPARRTAFVGHAQRIRPPGIAAEMFDCRGVRLPSSTSRGSMAGRVVVCITRDSRNVVARRVVGY